MSAEGESGWFEIAADIVATIAAIAYPIAMYFGLRSGHSRLAVVGLLLLFVPIAWVRLRHWRSDDLKTLAAIPLVTVALLSVSAALDENGLALLVPTVVNAGLLITFGVTLFRGTPMVERLARLQDPDLRDEEVAWCRLWTAIWCGFFALNGSTALVLAQWGTLDAWALYNGLIAYAAMGALFTTEWVIRKLRFGRRDGSRLERMLTRTIERETDA